nr:immunoglobulin light chain junction region [Macaca mulatta]
DYYCIIWHNNPWVF